MSTAIHEAAHGIVALAVGLPLAHISLHGDGTGAALIEGAYVPMDRRYRALFAWDRLTAVVAGKVGEDLAGHGTQRISTLLESVEQVDRRRDEGIAVDWAVWLARNLLRQKGRPQRTPLSWIRSAERRADGILRSAWPAVLVTAEALAQRGRLLPTEIKRLVDGGGERLLEARAQRRQLIEPLRRRLVAMVEAHRPAPSPPALTAGQVRVAVRETMAEAHTPAPLTGDQFQHAVLEALDADRRRTKIKTFTYDEKGRPIEIIETLLPAGRPPQQMLP
jgi:hypothetical protein